MTALADGAVVLRALEIDAARNHGQKTGDCPQQRRFAHTIGTGQDQCLAGGAGERNVADHEADTAHDAELICH